MAVFVVGDKDSLNESEQLIAQRLRDHHHLSVRVIDDDDITAEDASGASLLLISKTGESVKTGDMFRNAPVAVVFWEDNLQRSDFLGTSHDDGSQSTAWHGTGQRIEVLSSAGEDRTGGVTGEIPLLDRAGQEIVHAPQGGLVADAQVVATWPGEPDRPTAYTLAAGDRLASGDPTPGPRVFLPFYDDTFRYTTPEGLRLFDSLIAWAAEA